MKADLTKALEMCSSGMSVAAVAKKLKMNPKALYSARYYQKSKARKMKKTKAIPASGVETWSANEVVTALLETANDCHRLANVLQTVINNKQ